MAIVYIVEDGATLRDELAHLLELNGYETRACDDFETAAHDIVDVNPDCVILDLGLPGADGQSICRDVRRQSDVPIIVLTAKNDEFTEVMSLNLGAHDFVAKPYRPAVLLARIASLVKRHATASAEASTITHGEVTLDLSAFSPCSCAMPEPSSRVRKSCATSGSPTPSSMTTRSRST